MTLDDPFVLLAGASGKTGRETLDVLLDAGLRVRALTSSPEKVETLDLQGADEVVVGDLLDPADARRAVDGDTDDDAVDVVLCTVGDSPGLRSVWATLVDGEGVTNLVDAAGAAGVERFALVSSLGVGDSEDAVPAPLRAFFDLFGILDAKERGENALRESGLTHTILRPGRLTADSATEDVLVGAGGVTVAGSIPRADVARLLAAAPFTPDAANRTFEVVSRSGLDGDATGLVDVDWNVPESVVPGR
ncbi:SDR family oxidoreductase [Halomarina oriensis]|uniref:NAD(P)H-binding protein n=1 Tax=Halomarina oriensis TaxID=671145 RepID=A0A6B0GMH0_9EURY|nr:SDR family oxidoreductase [Halomarina oriensis]MWG35944.1 NAD(P)H-binding protein [Halomarina oriensis]